MKNSQSYDYFNILLKNKEEGCLFLNKIKKNYPKI